MDNAKMNAKDVDDYEKEYILYSNGIDRRNDGFLRPNHRK